VSVSKPSSWRRTPNLPVGTAISLTLLLTLPGSMRAGAVGAGASHTAVVKTTDGTLWTWGSNANGRLGYPLLPATPLPLTIPSLGKVVAVAVGGSHTLALLSDGSVWSWGLNESGQLGNGTNVETSAPGRVGQVGNYLARVVGIAAGDDHSLAWKADGSLWVWGDNGSGQLGLGDTKPRSLPVQVTSLKGATTASAGGSHTLAVASGTVYAWGSNASGQIGLDSFEGQTSTPRPIESLSGVVEVAAGGSHSLALTADGHLWSWGSNSKGQLGSDVLDLSYSPIEVTSLADVSVVSAGRDHSVAVGKDGIVRSWGDNAFGQLGLGDGSPATATLPEAVPGIMDAVSIVAAADHTLAITPWGVVWAWGKNDSGQLGDGTRTNRWSPVAISEAGFTWKVGTPTFSLSPGTYPAADSTTVACATGGATIRYTLDGEDPTLSSPSYGAAIAIDKNTTLKARAWYRGIPVSNVGTAVYTLKPPPPTLSPLAGAYSSFPNVTITPGDSVRYTLDGSDPTASSALYSSKVIVPFSLTLKARVIKDGWDPSDVVSAPYILKVATPTLSPGGGVMTAAPTVTVNCTTAGAVLHYTTDGRDPVEADPTVSAGSTLVVSGSSTLKVRGWLPGWLPSDVGAGTYYIHLGPAATPTFSVPGGSYSVPKTLSLATATLGAMIRYTLDGSDPNESSPIFMLPLVLNSTTTVKARAFAVDREASAIATATYTINLGTVVAAPALSVPSGTYTSKIKVAFSVATPGAVIHYTTNGAEPVETDPVPEVTGIDVDRAQIVKAKAWKSGIGSSVTTRRDYVITGAVAAADVHTLALKTDGTLWSWGRTTDGTPVGFSQSTVPVQVPNLPSSPSNLVVAIAAGQAIGLGHSLALEAAGTVKSWGFNDKGQLGNGDLEHVNQPSPVAVKEPAPGTGLLSGIVAIAAGAKHSLALKSDGTVFAWGSNESGQLGINSPTTLRSELPLVAVTPPPPGSPTVVAIAAGANHCLALKSDGTLWAWGLGTSGQIGDGANLTRYGAVAVQGLTGISRIAAGVAFSLALQTNGLGRGTVWAWGLNSDGQLGDGSVSSRNTPSNVASDMVAPSAGGSHSLAVSRGGDLWTWGQGFAGQLGDGSPVAHAQPQPLAVFDLLAVEGGIFHSVAIAPDGGVLTWGRNFAGQLGDGTTGVGVYQPTAIAFSVGSNDWLTLDTDGDGLSNAGEYRLGSDPLNPDSDGNQVPDGTDAGTGGSPTDPDPDDDGLTSTVERMLGTDPFRADTDGDGHIDGLDAFPLDNTKWEATPTPGDTTPPVITLQEPTNAILLP
jgi:alpha-tubulin suppressor-like RCC1 family protein